MSVVTLPKERSAARLPADERRQAILDAAFPLFATNGFAEVTTRQIAEKSGVSEALLYRHFRGKQELFDALLAQCIEHATEEVGQLESLPDSTGTLMAATYLMAWKIYIGTKGECKEHKPDMTRLMMRSLAEDGVFAREFLRRTSELWISKLQRCVEAAQAAGDLIADRTSAEVSMWLTHHLFAALTMFNLPKEPVVSYPLAEGFELFEHAVLFCLRGLGLTEAAIQKNYTPQTYQLFIGNL